MLLLFYVQILSIFALITWSLDFIKSFKIIYEDISTSQFHYNEIRTAIFIIVAYLLIGLISVMMFFFFKFHRKLVRENKTTIENIEHNSDPNYISKYDISPEHNINQVMGTNKWLWWIPIIPLSNIPKGNGTYFDKKYDSEDSSYEEDNRGDDNRPNNYGQNNAPNNQVNAQVVPERLSSVDEQARLQNVKRNTNQAQNQNNMQEDRMTIHDDRANKWKNLNNIVKSDNSGQIYKSSMSDENSQQVETKEDHKFSHMKFTNKIDLKNYEEMK